MGLKKTTWIVIGVCLAAFLTMATGCSVKVVPTASHTVIVSPSPSPTWHEVAWMNDSAMVGMSFSKPFRVTSPRQRVEWSVKPGGLYKPSGVNVYIGPEAKTNDLDDEAVCIVRTVKDGTGHKFLHLKPGRYVLSFEATFGDDVKVRLSEDRLTPSP